MKLGALLVAVILLALLQIEDPLWTIVAIVLVALLVGVGGKQR